MLILKCVQTVCAKSEHLAKFFLLTSAPSSSSFLLSVSGNNTHIFSFAATALDTVDSLTCLFLEECILCGNVFFLQFLTWQQGVLFLDPFRHSQNSHLTEHQQKILSPLLSPSHNNLGYFFRRESGVCAFIATLFFQVATAAAVEYSPPLTPLFIIFTPSLWLEEEEESFTHAQESEKRWFHNQVLQPPPSFCYRLTPSSLLNSHVR